MTDPKGAPGDGKPVVRDSEVLPDAAERRLSHQLARAYRGTYGAKTGLRTVVTAIARQLLRGGLPRDLVLRTLEQRVLEHPARPAGAPPHHLTGAPHAQRLVELMQECVAEAERPLPGIPARK